MPTFSCQIFWKLWAWRKPFTHVAIAYQAGNESDSQSRWNLSTILQLCFWMNQPRKQRKKINVNAEIKNFKFFSQRIG